MALVRETFKATNLNETSPTTPPTFVNTGSIEVQIEMADDISPGGGQGQKRKIQSFPDGSEDISPSKKSRQTKVIKETEVC